jgi:hypothetical protein
MEVSMKRKLLLAVVWIALAGGIAAVIIFPPDSVLTSISPLDFFRPGSVRRNSCGSLAMFSAIQCASVNDTLWLGR